MFFSKYSEFIPKSLQYLGKRYSFQFFKKDLIAGITIGIIALPLAMAFAIASGVGPEKGIYTAIIAGFLISLLGGSKVQIGGPTGAFIVIVYGVVQRTGYSGLCLSTLIAAAILILLGLFRLGSWIRYVPHPLITGFTTGIAVVIFSTQIKEFFGLKTGSLPADFIGKWGTYIKASPSFDPTTLGVAAGTLGAILLIRRYIPQVPWGIAAIILSTIVCAIFHLPIETIASRFGEIPHSLPIPSLPSLSIPAGLWPEIFMDGLAIAFLGGIESLLCAVIADGMIGGRHRPNCELVAQGIANLGSILFGGIPATGAIARTAANVKSGAQTPMAGMIHAITLLVIVAFLAPIVSLIPLAALASVLIMVAWNMSEASHFANLLKAPMGDRAVLLAAFLLTVFVDITAAIVLGMVLASFSFMIRMSSVTKTVPTVFEQAVPEGIEVHEIQGPFFFGAASMLKDLGSETSPKVLILWMRHVPVIDASGMHALKEFSKQCKRSNTILLLSGISGRTEQELKKFGVTDETFHQIELALAKAREMISTT
jgi:SulP family sulfate permease